MNGGDKAIDVAVKYGYDSPTAFTRAFQAFHGVTPTATREKGVTLKAYPAIAFQVQIKGASVMDYKLVDKEAFRIVGYKLPTSMENGNCYAQIPQFWNETASSGGIARLGSLLDGEPHGMLGVSVCCEPMTETSRFDLLYCRPDLPARTGGDGGVHGSRRHLGGVHLRRPHAGRYTGDAEAYFHRMAAHLGLRVRQRAGH